MAPRLKATSWFAPPVITPGRAWFAMGVALVTDALQVLLGPLGWFFVVQVLDVIAMLIIVRTIGFHPLLLPTFVAELFPVVDVLPTWTGCTAAVLALRKWARDRTPPGASPVIDAEVTVSPAPPPAPPALPKLLPPDDKSH